MTDALSSSLHVEVQVAVDETDGEEPPAAHNLTAWAQFAYGAVANTPNEVTIRLVDQPEMTALNRDYRGQDKPTNVLSFPFEVDPDIDLNLLGDIVICHSVVVKEAAVQNKSVLHHYAHMVTHGVLHLCGYDHQEAAAAQQMEALETQLLAGQCIADPYQSHQVEQKK